MDLILHCGMRDKYVIRCSTQSEKQLHVRWCSHARGKSEIPGSLGGWDDAAEANRWAVCWLFISEIFLDEAGEHRVCFHMEWDPPRQSQRLQGWPVKAQLYEAGVGTGKSWWPKGLGLGTRRRPSEQLGSGLDDEGSGSVWRSSASTSRQQRATDAF